MNKNLSKSSIAIRIIICFIMIISCSDDVTSPNSVENVLCYVKSYNGHWEVFSNNISGTNPQNISNYSDDDEYPQWSPDGRYIAYSRSVGINGPLVILYDTKNKTETNLTSDGGGSSNPQWLPNGKVCFGYPYFWSKYHGTYIMDTDGSNKKKILDSTATIYFYNDSYTFIYIIGTKVYKTNIDNTINEFIVELQPTLGQFITVRDFNPLKGLLLVNTNTIHGISSAIAEYNVETKQLNVLVVAEEGFILVEQRYSKDYSKIVFVEINTDTYEENYLSIFGDGEKRRLVHTIGSTNNGETIDYSPMQFSYDSKYVAFSKNVSQGTQWASWQSYLYVANVLTGTLNYIDEGHSPSWNPTP